MSTPIPVDAWLVVLVVGCLCLACYGLGGDHMKRAEDYRFAFVVQTNRHHATALRHLYDALELLMPEMEPEPQPGPTLRQRLAARARQAGAWVKARFRGPMEVEVIEEEDTVCPCGHEMLLEVHRRPIEPDPAPVTQPDIPAQPGPATEPQPAIGTRVEDLSLAMALAEIEDKLRRWQGSHA